MALRRGTRKDRGKKGLFWKKTLDDQTSRRKIFRRLRDGAGPSIKRKKGWLCARRGNRYQRSKGLYATAKGARSVHWVSRYDEAGKRKNSVLLSLGRLFPSGFGESPVSTTTGSKGTHKSSCYVSRATVVG